MKRRKLSQAKAARLYRLHGRDCPARISFEFGCCLLCDEFTTAQQVADQINQAQAGVTARVLQEEEQHAKK